MAVFDKHVDSKEEHVLGVVFDNEDTPMSVDDTHWRAEKFADFSYHVSSFPFVSHILTDVSLNLR